MSLCIRLMVCCPQALEASGVIQSESGSLRGREVDGVKFQSKRLKIWGVDAVSPKSWDPRAALWGKKRDTPAEAGSKLSPLPFCSIEDLHGLESDLLYSVYWTKLISSGNTLTVTPRNNVRSAIGVSFNPVNLSHKINHHWCRDMAGYELRSDPVLCHETGLQGPGQKP